MKKPRTRQLVLFVLALGLLSLTVPQGARADQPACGGEWTTHDQCVFDNVGLPIGYGGIAFSPAVATIRVSVEGADGRVYGSCTSTGLYVAACGNVIMTPVPESPLLCVVDGIVQGLYGCGVDP